MRLDGRERLVFQDAGSLTLRDVAIDGHVLLTRDEQRAAVVGCPPGTTGERDLSWFDDAGLAAVSSDGRVLLFGDRFGMYLRGTDGSPAKKLGAAQGYPDDLSPDGRLVLATTLDGAGLFLVPTGPGQMETLKVPGLESFQGSMWFPVGRRLLVSAHEPGRKLRSYVVALPGGSWRALTDEDTWGVALSPDGALVAAVGHAAPITVWPADASGASRVLPGSRPGDRPASWSADGKSLWVFRRGEVPAQLVSVDVASGRRSVWRTIEPPDAAGVFSIDEVKVTPSGSAYFYSYSRTLSELYAVRGLR
jgi:hypothetical protein